MTDSDRTHALRDGGASTLCGIDGFRLAFTTISADPGHDPDLCGNCRRLIRHRCQDCGYAATRCDCAAVALAGGRRQP
jgi:hypothetical protein